MRIGDVVKRSGVPATTLRYYEDIGLIAAPTRTDGGHRDYDEHIFEVLKLIQVAQQSNFSLADILHLLHSQADESSLSASWRHIAAQKLVEVEQTIQDQEAIRGRLQASLTCECADLQTCDLVA